MAEKGTFGANSCIECALFPNPPHDPRRGEAAEALPERRAGAGHGLGQHREQPVDVGGGRLRAE